MITLFGATGYTGSLIASILEREGIPCRIAGRSAEKLKLLSSRLPSQPAWLTADAEQPSTLAALLKDTHLLINCVGPFTDMGERVLSLAAVAGIHYLDTTNEMGYVYRAQTYHTLAQRSKAAIVPACAFEVALADCAAALLARSIPFPCQTVDVVYHLSGSASRGTRRSALRSLATSWFSYSDGVWKGEVPGQKRQWFNLQAGRLPAFSFPSSESVTIPGHLATQRITTWMTGSSLSTFIAPLLVPLFARFLRSWPGRSALWAADRTNTPTNASMNSSAPFEVSVILSGENQSRAISLTGVDAYALTAEIVVFAAKTMTQPDFHAAGVLAPSQVLDPLAFFRAASAWGLRLSPDLTMDPHD